MRPRLPEFLPPSPLGLEQDMLGLAYTLDALLSPLPGKFIQFLGSRPGEGTTTLTREFARVAATRLGKSVLLFDADRHQPAPDTPAGHETREVERLLEGELLLEQPCGPLTEPRFVYCPIAFASVSALLSAAHVGGYLEKLRQHFDLILIDSPAVTEWPESLAFARLVDGVVLVV